MTALYTALTRGIDYLEQHPEKTAKHWIELDNRFEAWVFSQTETSVLSDEYLEEVKKITVRLGKLEKQLGAN